MPSQPPPSTSNSGIRQLTTGESVIPASKRADGSVRKEIRVKPGYKPPEDVEVYKNRTAAAWKNRGKGGVPGAGAVEGDLQLAATNAASTAAANKNAKRREARKKAAAVANSGANGEGGDEENGDVSRVELEGDGKVVGDAVEDVDPAVEKAKEARKLAKKLRQARELKEKKDNGTDLLPEQFAKVIKINELIRQLNSLGFDAEGEKKTSDGEESKQTDEIA